MYIVSKILSTKVQNTKLSIPTVLVGLQAPNEDVSLVSTSYKYWWSWRYRVPTHVATYVLGKAGQSDTSLLLNTIFSFENKWLKD